MSLVLVLRPEPGASATAARARARGLTPVIAPLFETAPIAWDPVPAADYDAVLLTSANAARHLGTAPPRPCYAVGEATAEAAREAGFEEVRAGDGDGAAAVAMMARDGVRRALHLCGRDHLPLSHPELRIERRIVYAAEALPALPAAARGALERGAVVLFHSPRAATAFAALVPDRGGVRIAAISAAAAAAAGEGWAAKAVAAAPRDEALLEVAAGLCNIAPPDAAAAGY
ncbi:MAG TPA: uroporphyrinogen-III synthase [Allosphingosinicella sp.]